MKFANFFGDVVRAITKNFEDGLGTLGPAGGRDAFEIVMSLVSRTDADVAKGATKEKSKVVQGSHFLKRRTVDIEFIRESYPERPKDASIS